MSQHYSKQMASHLIDRLGTRDPEAIAKELGISLRWADLGGLKGFYSMMLGSPYIVLNNALSRAQARSVLAHELGHHVLHEHLIRQDGIREIVLYDMSSQPEYEADVFAAHLLTDEAEVERLAEQGYTTTQIAAVLSIDQPLLEIFLKTNL